MDITLSPSPNHDERKHPVDMIVLHYTGMQTGQAAFDQLRNPDAKVSSHYLLWEDGRVDQLVAEDRRAWHAGVSRWGGRENCNDFSIGVELEGTDTTPYTEEQYDTLRQLVAELRRRYPALSAGPVLGHSDIAPGRKTDPGAAFDWRRLRLMLREEPLPSDGSCTA